VRIAGTPRLNLKLSTSTDHGHVTPTLVDIAPDGSPQPISRGFLNLRYRDGLASEVPMPPGRPDTATVRFSPQDHTVRPRPPHRRRRRRLERRLGAARRARGHGDDRVRRVDARAARRRRLAAAPVD